MRLEIGVKNQHPLRRISFLNHDKPSFSGRLRNLRSLNDHERASTEAVFIYPITHYRFS